MRGAKLQRAEPGEDARRAPVRIAELTHAEATRPPWRAPVPIPFVRGAGPLPHRTPFAPSGSSPSAWISRIGRTPATLAMSAARLAPSSRLCMGYAWAKGEPCREHCRRFPDRTAEQRAYSCCPALKLRLEIFWRYREGFAGWRPAPPSPCGQLRLGFATRALAGGVAPPSVGPKAPTLPPAVVVPPDGDRCALRSRCGNGG